MKKIRDLFLEKTVYQRDHLITAITLVKKYPIEHIYYALTQFVNNKNETLMDKYGRTGYLVSRGNFYAFQPNEIMDETISTFERSVPVDYKPVSLRMEVAKEISAEPTAEPEPPAVQGFDTIIKKMRDIANLLAQKDLKIKATDKNWYKHANQVVNELLTVHEMPSELIHKYVLFHFLDTLSAAEKLELVTNINTNDANDGYATILKLYFDDLMLVDEEGNRAIILADGEMNQLFVTNANEWVPAKFTDINAFSNARKARCIIPKASINRTDIGFMHPFKQKEIVFKTKDMTQKRNNKGAYCADSSKPMIAAKIGAILNEPALYQSTTIERPELCILLEILMRWLTEKSGVVYFFRPEQVNEMDVTNMKL
jgi:hypothetical protein